MLAFAPRYGWNQTEILQRTKAPFDLIDGYFIVQDVGVNSVYAAGWGVLADLASLFDANVCASVFPARCWGPPDREKNKQKLPPPSHPSWPAPAASSSSTLRP